MAIFLCILLFATGLLHSSNGELSVKDRFKSVENPPLSDLKKDIQWVAMEGCDVERDPGRVVHGAVAQTAYNIEWEELCVSVCYQYASLGFQCSSVNYYAKSRICELLKYVPGRLQNAENGVRVVVKSCGGSPIKINPTSAPAAIVNDEELQGELDYVQSKLDTVNQQIDELKQLAYHQAELILSLTQQNDQASLASATTKIRVLEEWTADRNTSCDCVQAIRFH